MSKLCEKKLKTVSSHYKIKDYMTTTVYGVLFPTYEIDEDGNQIEMTSKNKKNVKKQAEEAWQKVSDGESLKKIVKEYGLSYAGEKSYRSDEEDSLWDSIKNLKDGEYSGVLETEQGYSIIQMVSRTDQEKTKEAFESALEEAKREAFLEYYTDKYEDEYHTRIEEDIWDVLPLASEHHET
jgi:CRISPR/Cas system CSM-associated protein Csm4 (group 5 of RAMP superfamily)